MKIPVDKISPNPEQPRKVFAQADLMSLAESIRDHGLLQPILVEPADDGQYVLIAGERRWRAHQMLGWTEIEANVRAPGTENTEREHFILAMLENMQRSNLNVVEEAKTFQRMTDELGMSNEEIARQTGYSEATVYSRKCLLMLEPSIQQLFVDKSLPYDFTVISALLSLPEEQRLTTALRFARNKTSAKWIAILCKRMVGEKKPVKKPEPKKEIHVEEPLIEAGEESTALKLAAKNAKQMPTQKHYNAICQAGIVPPWELVKTCVEKECKKCALYDYAESSTCRECPLPGFLARLMELVNRRRVDDGKN